MDGALKLACVVLAWSCTPQGVQRGPVEDQETGETGEFYEETGIGGNLYPAERIQSPVTPDGVAFARSMRP